MSIKKIGILTGGGDCPGLNAVIASVVKTAVNKYGIEVVERVAVTVDAIPENAFYLEVKKQKMNHIFV